MRHHINHPLLHQRRKANGRAAIIGEYQKRTTIRHETAMQGDAVHRLEFQAGGRDDDVSLDLGTGLQPKARPGEGLDLVRDHRGLAGLQRLEEVAIRSEAQPLVPGIVAR